MEHSPPPFFKRGPAPLVRLFFFASLSVALLVLDARFRYTEAVRGALALVVYPIQRIAVAPIDFLEGVGGYFSSQSQLLDENAALRAQALANSQDALRFQAAQAESAQLRRMLGAAEKLEVRAMPAEILYAGRDPYSHKVFIDRGGRHGVRPGSPVADDSGVVGQVTRVHALLSEVTLLTDPDQAIPVQVLRNGLRAVAFGGGNSGMLELRFMPANAEIQNGDRLVTSGIDGTYRPACRSPPWWTSNATPSTPSRASSAGPPRVSTAASSCWCCPTTPSVRRALTTCSRARGAAWTRRAARGSRKPRGSRRRPRPPMSPDRSILVPARASTIIASFALALFLDFLPWRDLRLVPDFVALVLAFWCVRQPRLVGLGIAWALGLVSDAGNGVLLGQHALAYSVLAFLAIWMSRRILWFGPGQQALHVAVILLAAQGVVLLVRLAAGDQFPGWPIVVGPLAGAALWPMLSWLLLLPQRRPEREQTI